MKRVRAEKRDPGYRAVVIDGPSGDDPLTVSGSLGSGVALVTVTMGGAGTKSKARAYLSIDDVLEFHEELGRLVRTLQAGKDVD
jgi:hypothetical protein